MRLNRFRHYSLGRFILIGAALLLSACASDMSQQDSTKAPPCTESWCHEQKDKTTAEIDNARNDEKRRNEMIKDNKQPIPGTYYPVDHTNTSHTPDTPQGISY
ncbi:hypothetical protein [Endozoicomonas numazuensis]|uniref:Lipoprotein n=1 Tax=Endozoicomonas numazuensis TaxID=1137799 RepID=A0A081NFG4_9GAMM|nr:hypothetical protein [Endozoicomonas numazuensis]KEQ17187.1 hypothetical protein GZ78_15195 [Endozoicomonas numazuensis]